MSATQEPTLAQRQSALKKEIDELIEERDRLHSEFTARCNAPDHRPTEDEVRRFNARKRSDDESVRPTDEEIRRFNDRKNSDSQRPTDEEVRDFNTEHDERKAEIRSKLAELKDVDEQVEEQGALTRSRSIAAKHSRGEFDHIDSVTEPMTYRRDNQRQQSYFLDLAASQNVEFRSIPDPRVEGFEDRLRRHVAEMDDILPARWAAQKRRAEEQVENAERELRGRHGFADRGLEMSPFERQMHARATAPDMEQRAPSRIVGQGGYGIPPLWLIQDYIPALRPGRVAAGLCRQMTLPEGTDSINIPRLLTPTLTGIQSADAAPVPSRDFSDTFQQANVKTITGQEDVPIQLIEQSPGQILDQVLMTDLIADYNKQVDLQVITGNGTGAPLSGGQVVGLYPATNWGATSVPFPTTFGAQLSSSTQFVPAQSEFFQCLAAMASKTSYARFNLRDFNLLMHPRRHFWSVSGLDALGRGLGSDDGFGPYNASEVEIDPAPYEGYAGRVPFGPSVYIDANVPITDNGGTPGGGSNDIVIGAIWDDLWLFEGDLRTRVLTEVLSGTLEMRFQVYGYLAFLSRYGVSIAIGTSTGTNMGQPYTYSGSSTLGQF